MRQPWIIPLVWVLIMVCLLPGPEPHKPGPLELNPVLQELAIYCLGAFFLCYYIWMIRTMCCLANSLGHSGCLFAIFWVTVGTIIPFLNLLLLLWLSSRATHTLSQAGYKIGFLGADLRQFSAPPTCPFNTISELVE